MKSYARIVNLPQLLEKKSQFLFGPRQTGKSWLIQQQLESAYIIDLLESESFLRFQRAPQELRTLEFSESGLVVVDEIQRVPGLLDEIHLLIERRGLRFLLTGSSARKLRRGGVNLLGGRARTFDLFPLVSEELGSDFNLLKALSHGTIPSHYLSDDVEADLKSYVANYLELEIAAEGATRNIPAFSRFLEVAGLSNTQIINYAKIANDAQIAPSTVQEYFQVLRDTLIGRDLPAWKESKKRKASKTSKFYFFDVGIARTLQGRPALKRNSAEFGEVLESYLFHELSAYSSYFRTKPLRYWRSNRGDEVDFLLNESIAIEVKSSSTVAARDLKGLLALREESVFSRYLVVCQEPRQRRVFDNIEIWPVEEFLAALWRHEFV